MSRQSNSTGPMTHSRTRSAVIASPCSIKNRKASSTRCSLSDAATCKIRTYCRSAPAGSWLPQIIVGHTKHDAGKQVALITVVGKSSRLAHQRIDNVSVLDMMPARSAQPRDSFQHLAAVPDFQRFAVNADVDAFTDQPAIDGIDVVF